MLKAVRDFFFERNVLEVDVPLLVDAPVVDLHIEPMRAGKQFLITSPEAGMKCLLAKGSGDIYQLSHVFRSSESGRLHNSEFTMIEWYRVGMSYNEFIQETLSLLALFIGPKPSQTLTYGEAFERFLGINPFTASSEELCASADIPSEAKEWERETILHYLMGFVLEPKLPADAMVVITDFPKSEAALAKIEGDVAKRFEIYFGGVELANGYDELTDGEELRLRFEASNQKRLAHGKEALPLDKNLLHSMESFPDCCGVAVGFDRLLMLKLSATKLSEILPLN